MKSVKGPLQRWKVGLLGTHQTQQRKKKKKESGEGAKLGENFHLFSREKECEMESERKGEMGEGNGCGCVQLCLFPPSIVEV